MRKAVITSASGAQSAAIAKAFADAGYETVGLTRKATSEPGFVSADPEDADALARVLEGADVLAFTSPADYRIGVRERIAEGFVRAAERAGVGRIVVNTAGPAPQALNRPVAQALRVVRGIFQSGATPSVVIQPTVYMDNVAAPWVAPGIAAGVLAYPAPRAARVSWISHHSLGAFAVAAAEKATPGGQIFDIGGPEALTGEDVAARLSAVLGRSIRYEEVPLDAFAAGLNAAYGAPAGDDIADLYRHLQQHPDDLAWDGAAAVALGVAPEPFAAWAARQSW